MAGGGSGYVPGIKGGNDFRYQQQQAKKIKELTTLTSLPKINLEDVTIASFKPWIAKRLAVLTGTEDDDVVPALVVNWLEEQQNASKSIQAGELQLLIAPFITTMDGDEAASGFVKELWEWIGKAKAGVDGIPEEFVIDYNKLVEEEMRDEAAAKAALFHRQNESRLRRGGPSRPSRRYYERSRSRSRSPHHGRGRRDSRSRSRERYRNSRDSSPDRFRRTRTRSQRSPSPVRRPKSPMTPPVSPPPHEPHHYSGGDSSSYSDEDAPARASASFQDNPAPTVDETDMLRERAMRLMRQL